MSLPLDSVHKPYVYEPLSSDNNEIRVIEILPGRLADDIFLKLCHVPFGEGQVTTKYEALSYVWGDYKDRVPIQIADGSIIWSLTVTRNCEEALRHVRLEQESRFFWVDAICINQSDLDERARQVRLMFLIYSQASHVNVWLGPASEDSNVALEWIDYVGSRVTRDRATNQCLPLTEDLTLLENPRLALTLEQWQALGHLLNRPWWRRLWVWQEVRANSDRASLICGTTIVPWQKFRNAAHYLSTRPGAPSRDVFDIVMPQAYFVNELYNLQYYNPNRILYTMRRCLCADQRDRIYTADIFGGVSQSMRIIPDYTLSVADVYTDFTLKYLDMYKALDFLPHAGVPTMEPAEVDVPGLPSWVPNWSIRGLPLPFGGGHASGASQPSVVSATATSLVLRGVELGEVRELQNACSFDPPSGSTHTELWEGFCKMLRQLPPSEKDDNDIGKRLASVLSCGRLGDYYVPPLSPHSLEHLENFSLKALGREHRELNHHEQRACMDHLGNLHGRSLVTTDTDRIALVPNCTRAGDVLAVFLGFRQVAALRPIKSNDAADSSAFQFLGPSMCEGAMSGEALLGPLPQDHRIVWVLDENNGEHVANVRNDATGEILPHDPRLPPLSQAWKLARSGGSQQGFENTETGEWCRWGDDPRMGPEALEDRGVELQEFRLV